MELPRPPCPRLLRASASFFGLGGSNEDGWPESCCRVGKIACVISPRIARAILATRRCTAKRMGNGAPDFELAADASSRRLPTLPLSEETQAPRQAPPEPGGAGIWARTRPLDSFDG